MQLGNGLSLSGTTSPYTLSASGGGGGTQLYKHSINITSSEGSTTNIIIINESAVQFSLISDILKYVGMFAIERVQATFQPDPSMEPSTIYRYNVIVTPTFTLYSDNGSDAPTTIVFGNPDTSPLVPNGIYVYSDTVTAL